MKGAFSFWQETEFRKRTLTALILAPSIVLAIYILPFWPFLWLWTAVIALAAWEWAGLIGLKKTVPRAVFLTMLGALIALALLWPDLIEWLYLNFGWSFLTGAISWLDHAVWPTVLAWFVFTFALRHAPEKLRHNLPSSGCKIAVALSVLFTGWLFVARLRANFGELALLYLLGLVWMADIFAYLVGKRWGKIPLAPEVSPKKTVEGAWGGVLAGLLWTLICGLVYGIEGIWLMDFLMLAAITVLISIAGDLLVSLHKRWANVKDSGQLIPGHGGLLDRLDSLLAAAPVLYAGFFLRILVF